MKYIKAQWQAPTCVKALTTTRLDGRSQAPFNSLNLGDHVDDNPQSVSHNRTKLLNDLGLNTPPQWLTQVHGTDVVRAAPDAVIRTADSCWTDEPGQACVVMTADCLPVFFSNSRGDKVAVAHAGWRGLLDGVLEATLQEFDNPTEVHTWMGPAIGPQAFEVGEEVLHQFVEKQTEAAGAFASIAGTDGKYLANIYQLAEMRLRSSGVERVTGCDMCTFNDQENFFSYRRDGKTGRMASLIWIEK